MDTADAEAVEQVKANVRTVNQRAVIVLGESPITVDDESALKGRKVLAIEDGPTLTHGGMKFGAGCIGAEKAGAAELVDPRPFAVGEIAETYLKYPGLGPLLPAMGYGDQQIKDLEDTLQAAAEGGVEGVAVGTPIDLAHLIDIPMPYTRVRYELKIVGTPDLAELLAPIVAM